MGSSRTISCAALEHPNHSVARYAKNSVSEVSSVTQTTSSPMSSGWPKKIRKLRGSERRMAHCRRNSTGSVADAGLARSPDARPGAGERSAASALAGGAARRRGRGGGSPCAIPRRCVRPGGRRDPASFGTSKYSRTSAESPAEHQPSARDDEQPVRQKHVLHDVRRANDRAAAVRERA